MSVSVGAGQEDPDDDGFEVRMQPRYRKASIANWPWFTTTSSSTTLSPFPSPSFPSPVSSLDQSGDLFCPYDHRHLPLNLRFTMFSSLSLAALVVALVAPSAVNAHGYVHSLEVGGKNYTGWLPFTDP